MIFMKFCDERKLERIKEKIRKELEITDDKILTLMAQEELRRMALVKEDQKYIGWSIYFYQKRVKKDDLIRKLKRRLSDWYFEKERNRIYDPVYGYDAHIELGDFVSPSGTKYHVKITSFILAFRRYRYKQHRRVLFELWGRLFKISGEAYLEFEGYSKLIRRR